MASKADMRFPKSESVRVRTSPEQKERIQKAAAAAGMTVSAFILFALGEVAGEALGDLIVKGGKKRKN